MSSVENNPVVVKDEPVDVKEEPMAVKEEPVDVKVEPVAVKDEPMEEDRQEEAQSTEEKPLEGENEAKFDQDRIHVQNLPQYVGFKQFKKILERNLGSIRVKKFRMMTYDAYISFETAEDAQAALKIMDGLEVKKNKLVAKMALSDTKRIGPPNAGENRDTTKKEVVAKTARQSVTPLADLPYEKQLEKKNEECKKLAERLLGQMRKANVRIANVKALVQPIKPSPKISNYRNKCEFTVGTTLDGKTCVGFVGGRFSANQHYVIPIDGVENLSTHAMTIVQEFQNFVVESELPPFDEFKREGVWKLLTVREFSGDVMLIATVYPLKDKEREKELKEQFSKRFLDMSTFNEKGFRVTSLYWQSQTHCSDAVVYEHIGGTPYIYETVLDCRFRVSPSAFFQTNSQAASVLYSTIGEACGLAESSAPAPAVAPVATSEENGDSEEPAVKKPRVEGEEKEEEAKEETTAPIEKVLLDICCGTGTIGQCLLKKYGAANNIYCLGVEMIASAVEDAKQNAKHNGISNAKYIAGKAEDVFRSLKYYLPPQLQPSFEEAEVVGVLDPPRAGMHDKVILGCREMEKLRRLIFVSCDPAAAMKNIVDLCRPESKKFVGDAFSIASIQPVDMFPQTNHFEWVVTLTR